MRLVSVVTSTRSPLRSRNADLVQQVVDLPLHRTDVEHRIEQSRWTDHLLHHHAFRQCELELARCRRHVDHARHEAHELLEHQRTIVQRTRQAEAVVDERELARAVAVVHRAHLRQRHVRLVDHHEIVVGEIIEQAGRALAGDATADMPRVVLDARAGADLGEHLEVELRALLEALRFQQLALPAQLLEARSRSSSRMATDARSIVGRFVMKCFAG